MLINIDYRKKISIYEQIVNEIERYVSLGALKEGEKIPSVRALALDLGVNPNTVKKAYDILEEKGIIETLSTKGTFIVENTNLIKKEREKELLAIIKEKVGELENLGLSFDEIVEKLKK